MNIYSNNVKAAINKITKEVIFEFWQDYPTRNENDEQIISSELAARVYIPLACEEAFFEELNKLLSEENK